VRHTDRGRERKRVVDEMDSRSGRFQVELSLGTADTDTNTQSARHAKCTGKRRYGRSLRRMMMMTGYIEPKKNEIIIRKEKTRIKMTTFGTPQILYSC